MKCIRNGWVEFHQITIDELTERAGGVERLKQVGAQEAITFLNYIQKELVNELIKEYYQISLVPPLELANFVLRIKGT